MPSVDNRVVEMRFENKQFQNGVKDSISALEKLKSSLKLEKAADGIDEINKSVRKFDLSNIGEGVQTISDRFTKLGVIGTTVLQNLASEAYQLGKKLVLAIPDQIISGGKTRALNIENAKFQMEGLGVAWEDLKNQIDYGVKDTAYGLDEAAKVASQLIASNVDFIRGAEPLNGELDDMARALRAISGVAAMTNTSYSEIGEIFTTMASMGKVTNEELDRFAYRGLNVRAALAKSLNKTEADIREMATKGQLDFVTFSNAMDEAFGEHAKEANNTFTGALANMKAALSRIGADFATPILTNSRVVFNALRLAFNRARAITQPLGEGIFTDFMEKVATFAETRISNWDFSWLNTITTQLSNFMAAIDPFLDGFEYLAQGIDSAVSSITSGIAQIFPEITVESIQSAGETFKGFALSIAEFLGYKDIPLLEEIKSEAEASTEAVAETKELYDQVVQDIIAGKYGYGWDERKSLLEAAGFDPEVAQDAVNVFYGYARQWDTEGRSLITSMGETAEVVEETGEAIDRGFISRPETYADGIETITEAVGHLKSATTESGVSSGGVVLDLLTGKPVKYNAVDDLRRIASGIASAFDLIRQTASALWETVIKPVLGGVSSLAEPVLQKLGSISEGFSNWVADLKENDTIKTWMEGFVASVTNFWSALTDALSPITDSVSALWDRISPGLSSLWDGIVNFVSGLGTEGGREFDFSGLKAFFEWLTGLVDFENVIGVVTNIFTAIGTAIGSVLGGIRDAFGEEKFNTRNLREALREIREFVGSVSLTSIFTAIGIGLTRFSGITAGINAALQGLMVNISADTILKVAKAVGILAGSLFVLSIIPVENLKRALGALTALIAMVLGAMKILSGKASSSAGDIKSIKDMFLNLTNLFSGKLLTRMNLATMGMLMKNFATAVLELAAAVLVLSFIPKDKLLGAVAALTWIVIVLGAFMAVMQKITTENVAKVGKGNKLVSAIKGIIPVALAVLILAGAVKMLSNTENLVAGLLGFTLIMVLLGAFMAVMQSVTTNSLATVGKQDKVVSAIKGIIPVALAVLILAGAVKMLSNTENLAAGLLGFTLIMVLLGAFMAVMQSVTTNSLATVGKQDKVVSAIKGIIPVALAVLIIAGAVKMMASEGDNIAAGILGLVVVMGALGLFMLAIKKLDIGGGNLAGVAGGILLLGIAMIAFAAALQMMDGISWTSFLMLAVSLVAFAAAAKLMDGATGAMGKLAGVLALVGLAVLALGIGLAILTPIFGQLADGVIENSEKIIAAGQALLDVIIALAPKFAEAVATILVAIIGVIPLAIPGLVDAFLQMIEGVMAGINEHLPTILGYLASILATINEWFGQNVEPIAQILLGNIILIINSLSKAILNNGGQIWAALGNLGLSISSLIGDLIKMILDSVADLIDNIPGLGGFADKVRGWSDSLAESLLADKENIGAAIDQNSETVREANAAAGQEMIESSEQFISDAKTTVGNLVTGNEIIANGDGVVRDLLTGEVISENGTGVKDADYWNTYYGGSSMVAGSEQFVSDSETASNNVISGVDGFIDAVKERLSESGIDTSSLFEGVNIDVGEAFDVSSLPNSILTSLSDSGVSVDELKEIASEYGVNFSLGAKEGAESKEGELAEAGTNVFGWMEDAFSSAGEFGSPSVKMKRYGQWFDEGFANGVTSFSYLAKSASRRLITLAISSFAGIQSKFYTYGKYAAQGFSNGISSNAYLAVNAAQAMVNNALTAIKNAQKSNSPAKETIRLGAFFGQGFANGIQSMSDTVDDSATSMTENAISGVQQVIGRIIDAFNGDFDVDMTIRPVLDLSEIQNGASRVSSMLNGQSVSFHSNLGYARAAMANVNSGRDISAGLPDSNTLLIDEIHAMREDISNLEANMRNMQVVMNNGALVGQIGPTMNNWLGRSNSLKKRGG